MTLSLSRSALAVAIVASLFSGASQAGGWTLSRVVEVYSSPGAGGVFVKLGSMPNPDACPIPAYYFMDKNLALFREMLAQVMSAQAREGNVNVQIESCAGPGNQYPMISQLISY